METLEWDSYAADIHSWVTSPEGKELLLRIREFYREVIQDFVNRMSDEYFSALQARFCRTHDGYFGAFVRDISSVRDELVALNIIAVLQAILRHLRTCVHTGGSLAILDTGEVCQVPRLAKTGQDFRLRVFG